MVIIPPPFPLISPLISPLLTQLLDSTIYNKLIHTLRPPLPLPKNAVLVFTTFELVPSPISPPAIRFGSTDIFYPQRVPPENSTTKGSVPSLSPTKYHLMRTAFNFPNP
jgi:hypothetical protein